MSWISRAKELSIALASTLIALLILEFSYRLVSEEASKNVYSEATMLFESGKNFRNFEGYFKYFPNRSIRSMTLYSSPQSDSIDDIVIEYDYRIETNNIGLVMKGDVRPRDRVAFVIGDSFTEGQGATPWFYQLEDGGDRWPVRLVNLGILGTGPMQWKNLADAITEELELRVDALVINIIPGDMNRPIWTFNDRELRCLYNVDCDYTFGFQGYHFREEHTLEDVKFSVLSSIMEVAEKPIFFDQSFFLAKIKEYAKNSRVISDIYRYLQVSFFYSELVQMNEQALISIRDGVEGKLYVNVVAEKHINSTNVKSNRYAWTLIEFLKNNGIKYSWCDIHPHGFHENDGHPNSLGYETLKRCTEDALDEVMPQ